MSAVTPFKFRHPARLREPAGRPMIGAGKTGGLTMHPFTSALCIAVITAIWSVTAISAETPDNANPQPSVSDAATDTAGGYANGKVDRQLDRVGSTVDSRVDQKTDEAVDKTLNKVLDRLFK